MTLLLGVGVASAEPGFDAAQPVPVPGGVDESTATYDAVACATPTSCTAAGGTFDGEPFLTTETSGSWGAPSVIALPDRGTSRGLDVACPSAGSCVAAGSYQSSAGTALPLIVSQTSGTWGAPLTPAVPADAITGASEQAPFTAVWCASAGNCEIAGEYETATSTWRVMTATEASGSWGPVTPLAGSVPGSGRVLFSCTSIGACVAVAGGLSWSQSSGVWGSPSPFGATGDPHESFHPSDVACTGAATCIAVGTMEYASGYSRPSLWGAADVESSGTWGVPAGVPATPALSPSLGETSLSAISCVPTECVAVGSGDSGYDLELYEVPIALTWSAGTWSSADLEQLPLPGLHLTPDAYLGDVACASATQCLGVGHDGFYGNGNTSLFPFSTAITPVRLVRAPSAPSAVLVAPEIGGAVFTSSPPLDDGGAPIQSYTATASPGGESCTSHSSYFPECTITGLQNGHRYVVAVRDTNGTDASPAAFARVVAGAPPTAPSHLLVRATATAASVGWHGSVTPPGEPVLRYVVELLVGGRMHRRCVTTADACTLRGLAAGDAYAAFVSAIDATGASPQARIYFVAR